MSITDNPPTTRPTTDTILANATWGTSDNRLALHAYLSAQAHTAWHTFAAEQGASVSALLEALAAELELDPSPDGLVVAARLDAVAKVARKIDAARRRRTR